MRIAKTMEECNRDVQAILLGMLTLGFYISHTEIAALSTACLYFVSILSQDKWLDLKLSFNKLTFLTKGNRLAIGFYYGNMNQRSIRGFGLSIPYLLTFDICNSGSSSRLFNWLGLEDTVLKTGIGLGQDFSIAVLSSLNPKRPMGWHYSKPLISSGCIATSCSSGELFVVTLQETEYQVDTYVVKTINKGKYFWNKTKITFETMVNVLNKPELSFTLSNTKCNRSQIIIGLKGQLTKV